MEIICKNQDFVICVKAPGMDSEHALPQAIIDQEGGQVYPIHRLDTNVGGLMVFARNRQAAANLSRLVQEGNLEKEYVALCHGAPPPTGDWQDLLFKDSRKNKVFVVKRERKGVKPARLTYTRLRDGDPALVRVRLHTGRSHQIRVQFASRGFPLLGDHKYGARDELDAPQLFSCCLRFPWKGEMLCFEKLPPWAEAAK